MTFQTQNDELLTSFFEHTFFRSFKSEKGIENMNSFEFMLGSSCNLQCKYCYYTNYGKELYPRELENPKLLTENANKVFKMLRKNNMKPKSMEIFAGEPLIKPFVIDIIKKMIIFNEESKGTITIPTNCTWAMTPEKLDRVEDLLNFSDSHHVRTFLSASIDGKFCETNRPLVAGVDTRDDDYYDRLFAFARKHQFGFHPMVYSEEIEKWKDNFLWFQEMFKKHNIPWDNLYLLEVRNWEWSENQMKELYEFLRFLIKWTFEKCGSNVDKYIMWVFKGGMNILRGPLSTIGRGIGCSMQAGFHLRIGDFAIVPCHRLSYPPYLYGWLNIDDDGNYKFKSHNVEMTTAIYTSDMKNQAYCEACAIKDLCALGCLGSQYEVNGDPFVPIPTMCKMEHYKVAGILQGFKDIGAYNKISLMMSQDAKIVALNNFGGFLWK